MKKTIAYLLFLLAALSASAQTRQMMLNVQGAWPDLPCTIYLQSKRF